MRCLVRLSGIMRGGPSLERAAYEDRTRPWILALLLRLVALVDIGVVLALVDLAVVVEIGFGEVRAQLLECVDILGNVAALDALAVLADLGKRGGATAVGAALRLGVG